jgi:hypothetical protein
MQHGGGGTQGEFLGAAEVAGSGDTCSNCAYNLGALLVTGIWGLERYANWLYGEKLPLLYGKIPLAWAFDTMDVGVLSLFIFWRLVEANRNLKRR